MLMVPFQLIYLFPNWPQAHNYCIVLSSIIKGKNCPAPAAPAVSRSGNPLYSETSGLETSDQRETVPSQTSDMGEKTLSVLVHSFMVP